MTRHILSLQAIFASLCCNLPPPGAVAVKLQNLRVITTQSLLPLAAITLATSIFVIDTLTDLELAVPAFYTAVVLMSVRVCKRRGVILVGLGCIALTLLSDVLTSSTASTEAGLINTGISLSAIATTVYLGLRIESARAAAFEAQSQLAHVVRVTTLGEMTASIAHEVNQPLAAVVINGNASLRWLADTPPNLDEARQAINRIVKDANRASDVVARVRALTRSAPREREWVSMNDIILGTAMLTEREIARNNVALETRLAGDLPLVLGDGVQLQQVILNLILNAIEAVTIAPDGARELVVSSAQEDSKAVRIAVQDSGAGLPPERLDRVFDAFYTTKPEGMGMGLTISRSIVEAHGGRIWATQGSPHGAVFQFTLPVDEGATA
jgi:C4-dicarboxylate-specific signal transduction histidine kinase